MNDGVELLLKRMDTHPEEFQENWADLSGDEPHPVTPRRQWGNIIYNVRLRAEWIRNDGQNLPGRRGDACTPLPFLTDKEVLTVFDKYCAIQRKGFMGEIMRNILHEPGQDVGNDALGNGVFSGGTLTTSTAIP